ncbi:MAG: hypothetical protein AAFN30_15085, partial [Actinomycetota bacterium]
MSTLDPTPTTGTTPGEPGADDRRRRADLRRMKAVATGLLIPARRGWCPWWEWGRGLTLAYQD